VFSCFILFLFLVSMGSSLVGIRCKVLGGQLLQCLTNQTLGLLLLMLQAHKIIIEIYYRADSS
jgi:hypothetical protein